AVHLYDAARGVLRAEALSGAEWDGLPIERPANVGLPGVVFEAQTPVLVPQPLTHPRSIARDWWQKRPKGTYYGVPIAVGETFVGVLDYILPDGLPDAEEQEALRLLAAQAGIALRNAGLYQTERVQAERIRALAAVNQQMSSTLDLDELLRTICESAAALIGVRFVAFWLADEHARTVTLASTSEPEIAGDAPRRMASYDLGATGWVARHRERLVIDDITNDDRIMDGEWLERWGPTASAADPGLAAHGAGADVVRGLDFRAGEGVPGWAIAERKIVTTPDVLREPRVNLSPELRERVVRNDIGAVVGVPLLTRDSIVGALALGDRRG